MLPWGTLGNVATVLIGGTLGLVLGDRLPERCRQIVFQGLGLCLLTLGVRMAIQAEGVLTLIFSVVLGGVTGEALRLEARCERLADAVKTRLRFANPRFSEGLVSAVVLFCVGPMTILGSFDEGLRNDPSVLLTKALLDGFAAIPLAATYGAGVVFSAAPLFLYQYGLTLGAGALQPLFSTASIAQLTATGGVLIVGIALNLLGLTTIRVLNLLPALPLVVALTLVFGAR